MLIKIENGNFDILKQKYKKMRKADHIRVVFDISTDY
jgi:hypothetical protein